MKDDLINYLQEFVSPHRLKVINETLEQRTRHISVVLENIYQSHNASAVLRSCECFGVQDVHVLEKGNKFSPNSDVALGSSKWLDIHKYKIEEQGVGSSLQKIKGQGYRLVATSLRAEAKPIQELNLDQKTALCFGTEEEGLSEEVYEYVDECVKIPMYGFTQSFNVSVSVALSLYELINRLHASEVKWQLSDEEKQDLRLKWMVKSIKSGEQLVERWMAENSDE